MDVGVALLVTVGTGSYLVGFHRGRSTREKRYEKIHLSEELEGVRLSEAEEAQLKAGYKLQTIKLLRDRTSLDLNDAYDVVSAHQNKLSKG